MSVSFSDQMRVLWKTAIYAVVWSVWLARNQWIFKGKAMDFRFALSLVWRAVSDANRLGIGCMRNCVDDLLILHRFDLCGRPTRAPVIKSVIWSPPAPGWIKVNTDGAALSSPDVWGYENFLQLRCPLILLGRMGGIDSGLRVILLMWFNCSPLAPSRFLGGFDRLGKAVSIRYR
ncbi:hypothetical protein Dsin_005136 [Dipteronia sinensis]|uniref:Uncharacterized protein n=1 Tax=Dipteronia sinensis TaxID=43782 RepID=A0AAE0AXC7_9ROSI|nr:hypothetical protein Dsin_005136 [Dipteronia sinensis]